MMVVVLSLSLALAAPSPSTELRLALNQAWAYDDEAVRAQVQVVEPERGMTVPRLDPVDGLTIGPAQGPAQSRTILNGVQTVSLTYYFDIRPSRSGRFTIGPARASLPGGRTIESNTVDLSVGKRPETGVRFRCEVKPVGGPVGYPFLVTYTVLFSGEIYSRSGFGFSLLSEREHGIQKLAIPLLDRTDLIIRTPGDTEDARKKQISLERGSAFQDGQVWKTYVFRYEVTPMAAGPIELGNARVSMHLVTGYRRVRTIFGIENEPVGQEFPADTGSVIYHVEDLPVEGKPAAFSGAVGRFSAEASATPTEVDAFAPIDIELRIRGEGLLDALKPPIWEEMPDLAAEFEIASDVDPGKVERDAKVFHKQIRPRGPNVTRIPALPYPYYDFAGKRYETAWTKPIPIRVRAVETVKAEEAVTSAREERPSRAAASGKAAAPPIQGRLGIGANYATFGRPVQGLRAAARLLDPTFLFGLVAPPAAFAGMLLFRKLKRRDPRRVRIRAAAGRARAALARPGLPPAAIARAYQDYFRDRLDLPAGEITPGELERTLRDRGVGEAATAGAVAALERTLAASFSAGAGMRVDAGALADAARTAIEEVERCLR